MSEREKLLAEADHCDAVADRENECIERDEGGSESLAEYRRRQARHLRWLAAKRS